MKEGLSTRASSYFRREDTSFSRFLKTVSPRQGLEYRNSLRKDIIDRSLAGSLGVFTLPLLMALSVAVKLEDGGSAFYVQERVGKNGSKINVIKIRSMVQDAEKNGGLNQKSVTKDRKKIDPRVTKLGRILRRFGLDEIPQLWQIVGGSMAFIGTRCNPQIAFNEMQDARPETYKDWDMAYLSAKPSIVNPLTALHPEMHTFNARYHLDTFYARRASLGFDMYLLWKTFVSKLGLKA